MREGRFFFAGFAATSRSRASSNGMLILLSCGRTVRRFVMLVLRVHRSSHVAVQHTIGIATDITWMLMRNVIEFSALTRPPPVWELFGGMRPCFPSAIKNDLFVSILKPSIIARLEIQRRKSFHEAFDASVAQICAFGPNRVFILVV